MKAPHLILSPDPLQEHSQLRALCGAEITDARFCLVWDSAILGHGYLMSLSGLRVCGKCLRVMTFVPVPSGYLYAARNGSEVRGEVA